MLIEFKVSAGRVEHPVIRGGMMVPRGTRWYLDPDAYEAHARTVVLIRRQGGWTERVVEDRPTRSESIEPDPVVEPTPQAEILPHQAHVIEQLKRDALLG